MVNEMTRERPTLRQPGHGRRWTIVLIVVAVVAVMGLGAYAIFAATGTDSAETAADLADQFLAGANANDGEAVASLFVEDGILDMVGRESQGSEAIAADVDFWSPNVSNWQRVGGVVATDAGTFTFAAQGDYLGRPHDGRGELDLQGDLLARLTWYGVTPAG